MTDLLKFRAPALENLIKSARSSIAFAKSAVDEITEFSPQEKARIKRVLMDAIHTQHFLVQAVEAEQQKLKAARSEQLELATSLLQTISRLERLMGD